MKNPIFIKILPYVTTIDWLYAFNNGKLCKFKQDLINKNLIRIHFIEDNGNETKEYEIRNFKSYSDFKYITEKQYKDKIKKL